MSTVLNQNVNQGTVVSASLPWSSGLNMAAATGLMSDADAASPANTLTVFIAASFDAQGLAFTRESGFGWQGGPGNGPPGITWGPGTDRAPTFVRVEMDIPTSFSVGMDLTLS